MLVAGARTGTRSRHTCMHAHRANHAHIMHGTHQVIAIAGVDMATFFLRPLHGANSYGEHNQSMQLRDLAQYVWWSLCKPPTPRPSPSFCFVLVGASVAAVVVAKR